MTLEDLTVIKQVMDGATIQGKDAPIFAKTLDKVTKAIIKAPAPTK